jgi:hypothetical protein
LIFWKNCHAIARESSSFTISCSDFLFFSSLSWVYPRQAAAIGLPECKSWAYLSASSLPAMALRRQLSKTSNAISIVMVWAVFVNLRIWLNLCANICWSASLRRPAVMVYPRQNREIPGVAVSRPCSYWDDSPW